MKSLCYDDPNYEKYCRVCGKESDETLWNGFPLCKKCLKKLVFKNYICFDGVKISIEKLDGRIKAREEQKYRPFNCIEEIKPYIGKVIRKRNYDTTEAKLSEECKEIAILSGARLSGQTLEINTTSFYCHDPIALFNYWVFNDNDLPVGVEK